MKAVAVGGAIRMWVLVVPVRRRSPGMYTAVVAPIVR
jgi:hypothetical protein